MLGSQDSHRNMEVRASEGNGFSIRALDVNLTRQVTTLLVLHERTSILSRKVASKMPDFYQHDLVTTIHDLRTGQVDRLEDMLREATRQNSIGLVLPVTASDMRAEPFDRIVKELADADYIHTIVVSLGVAPEQSDYEETVAKVASLGERAKVLWTDGPAVQSLYEELIDAGIAVATPGKGRSVWTAFGYLLDDPAIDTFVLHDCDIVDYDRLLLARLCLPMVHPALDFEFCKAYYARVTDRMHGRVVRLLVTPLVRALMRTFPESEFVRFLANFRYPLSGEFSLTRNLARTNRIPSDWGLEVGTLAEVYRNTSLKRVCQTDLCRLYEHKHQVLSVNERNSGFDADGDRYFDDGLSHACEPGCRDQRIDLHHASFIVLADRTECGPPVCSRRAGE